MIILVIYYSYEGNTRFIADTIAKSIGADLLELKPKKGIQSRGFMKYVWGGKQAVFGEKPELETLNKNPSEYDVIFIGTPVWAFTYAPAFRTFFDTVKLTDKKIALFCCNGGNKGKTFLKMREELKNNQITSEKEFTEPILNQPDKANAAKDWAKDVINRVNQ